MESLKDIQGTWVNPLITQPSYLRSTEWFKLLIFPTLPNVVWVTSEDSTLTTLLEELVEEDIINLNNVRRVKVSWKTRHSEHTW